jgi:hypothetical protein
MARGSKRRRGRQKITAPGIRWWGYALLALAVLVVAGLVVLALLLV